MVSSTTRRRNFPIVVIRTEYNDDMHEATHQVEVVDPEEGSTGHVWKSCGDPRCFIVNVLTNGRHHPKLTDISNQLQAIRLRSYQASDPPEIIENDSDRSRSHTCANMALDKTLESILRSECSHLGTQFTSRGASCVVAQPSGRSLFAKVDGSVEQTIGEAESLKAMGSALSGDSRDHSEARLTPEVHASGKAADGRAYLVTDYLELKPSINKAGQRRLGNRLAEMHKRGVNDDGRFGFGVATYCGVTVSLFASYDRRSC